MVNQAVLAIIWLGRSFVFSKWLGRFVFDIGNAARYDSLDHVHSAILWAHLSYSRSPPNAESNTDSGISNQLTFRPSSLISHAVNILIDWLIVSSTHLLGQQSQLSLGAPLAVFHWVNQTGHSTSVLSLNILSQFSFPIESYSKESSSKAISTQKPLNIVILTLLILVW